MKIYGVRIETVEQLPCEFIKSLMPKRYERSEKYLRKADQLRCLGAGLLMHMCLVSRKVNCCMANTANLMFLE